MKDVVLKLDMHDDKSKKKAIARVSDLAGVESAYYVNGKDNKLRVIGDVDPIEVAAKLRKICPTEIVSVDLVSVDRLEDEYVTWFRKEDPKKDPNEEYVPWFRKEKPKKDPKEEYVAWFQKTYGYHPATFYYHAPPTYGGYYRPVEEEPTVCVIC